MTPLPTLATRPRGARLATAATAFSAAWIAGLSIPLPSADPGAPGSAVLGAVAGHEAASAARAVLVHGVAALALVVVAAALARAIAATGRPRLGTATRRLGVAAAGLSLAQLALELVLAGPVASGGDAGAAAGLANAVNHLDGLKMLALAGLAAAGAAAHARLAAAPRSLSIALAATLVPSAVAYGLLMPALAPAAFVSLPLLLVWVTWTGLALRREAR